jgi:N-acetylglutamate synthase-like GNAT family acetyltransferase
MNQDGRVKTLSTHEQAEGVRDLFLEVYGDQYPVDVYYKPAELLSSQAENQVRCAVAEDGDGRVCGHVALYPSAPSRQVWELGAGLVAKRARGSSVIGQLSEHLLELAVQQELCQFVFAEAVCNHTVTQRHAEALGFVDTAVEIELMPSSAYTKEDSAVGRVSSVLSFRSTRPQTGAVRLPSFYRADLLKIYSGLPVEREFLDSLEGERPPTTTHQSSRIEMAGLLRFVVKEVGEDLASHLSEEADVFQLMLGLDLANLDYAVEVARAQGFFLGGLLPVWTGTDNLMLQRLRTKPTWDNDKIHTEIAKALYQRVRADAESVLRTLGGKR